MSTSATPDSMTFRPASGTPLIFLGRIAAELLRLSSVAEVSDIDLDFGVAIRAEMAMKTCSIPAELVHLAAEFNMAIMVSYHKCE